MKFLLTIIALLLLITGGLYQYTLSAPERLYNQIVTNKLKTKWFIIDKVKPLHLFSQKKKYDFHKTVDSRSWKSYHLNNLIVPLPVNNPFYFISPNLKFNETRRKSTLGLDFYNSKDIKMASLVIMPKIYFPDYRNTQTLFELPIVKNILRKKSNSEIWKDVFDYKVKRDENFFDNMIYNLYLIQFRDKFLPKNTLNYGKLVKSDYVVIELDYPNKDFYSQLFIKKLGNELHSFMFIGRKGEKLSSNLRSVFLEEIESQDSSDVLSDILVKEFNGLDYRDKIDHLGMLYLLSAWSHDYSRKEILEQAIFFLERGVMNETQLAAFYNYYYKRYGEVYTKKFIPTVRVSNELKLQLQITAEEMDKQEEEKLKKETLKIVPAPQKSLDEQFDKLIEDTKIKRSKTLRID